MPWQFCAILRGRLAWLRLALSIASLPSPSRYTGLRARSSMEHRIALCACVVPFQEPPVASNGIPSRCRVISPTPSSNGLLISNRAPLLLRISRPQLTLPGLWRRPPFPPGIISRSNWTRWLCRSLLCVEKEGRCAMAVTVANNPGSRYQVFRRNTGPLRFQPMQKDPYALDRLDIRFQWGRYGIQVLRCHLNSFEAGSTIPAHKHREYEFHFIAWGQGSVMLSD